MRILLVLASILCGTSAFAARDELTLSLAKLDQLGTLTVGTHVAVDGFPVGPARVARVGFERVDVYAPDAHVYVVTDAGRQELPRSTLVFVRGRSDDGTHIALALNPDGSFAHGSGSGPEGSFVLRDHVDASGRHYIDALPQDSALPPGARFDFRCGNDADGEVLGLGGAPAAQNLAEQLQAATSAPSAPTAPNALRYATVAIDTDSLFMARLFNTSNTTAASNWIAGMFNAMNAMYENNLQVRLQIGTTILRTSAGNDPYTGLSTGSANSADLNLFGSYWRANQAGVQRSFAMLLSGAIASTPNSCSAAGIAWINQYCQKGFVSGSNTVGSYSVNKVCTSINIDPNGSFDARIVGHEIGHNFGASHTHCTNLTTGAAPTGTNTIDACYAGEASSGCYSGATSCPAGGSGTIMSYCNQSSGCGTQNQMQFHATQVNKTLLPNIAANTPSCLSNTSDVIFKNGFE